MPTDLSASSLERFTTFGDLLRFLRRRAGVTQLELALAVGYSDAQISRLEQNLRLPDIPTVQARFVPALGIEHEPQTVARLLDLAANVRREDAPGLGLCPYKGLAYFDEADADLFVGRETLTNKLMSRVKELAAGEGEAAARFLGIVGASGSGKSSLVRAGLVPAIRWDKECADWQIHVITPTAHPLESLAASLTKDVESVTAAATLMDDLAREPRALQIFVNRRLEGSRGAKLLLVIDQFEELFTLCRSPQEQGAFVDCLLAAAAEPGGRVVTVMTLRADFYAHCAGHAALREALGKSQEYIGAMTDDELRSAIEEPARRGRWELEEGLVDLLLQDVGHEPGSLPLLSHALLETWQRRRGRMLTLSGYTASGGVRGAIAETAESVFVDQFTPEQQELARRVFLRLTELGDDISTGDSRRRIAFDEVVSDAGRLEITRTLVQRLADARLITTAQDSIEVAHEALIREWPRLRGWLDENRQGLRLQRRISDAAREWAAQDRDADLLFRGARLAEAEEWRRSNEAELNDLEREFLSASVEGREREAARRESERQQALEAAQKQAASEKSHAAALGKRALYLSGALVLALAMTLAALYFGAQARRIALTAQIDRRIATARELSAAALNNLEIDPERSILLALQAVSTTEAVDGSILPEALGALHRALVASPVRFTLRGHDAGVFSVAYHPDGSQFASIGADGTVIIWDSKTGAELRRVKGTTIPGVVITPQRIVYSRDGEQLLACEGNQVVLIDTSSGAILWSMDGHGANVATLAFSRDEALIASADIEGEIILWDAGTRKQLLKWDAHDAELESLAFSPDGTWLVSASDDATLKIWDVSTGQLLQAFTEFTGVVGPALFSPDGSLLAVSAVDGVHFWSYAPSEENGSWSLGQLEQLVVPGGGIAFSPDGGRIATSTPLAVWDAHAGGEIIKLLGHADWVMGLAFDPSGKHLASTSLDGTVKVWDVGPGQEELVVRAPTAAYGTRLTYNPTAHEFATNGGDGSATLWNASNGEPRLTLRGHEQEVLSVAYSADGSRFATGSVDGSAIVWNAATGSVLLDLVGHEAGVRDIAFSLDGKLVATGGFDATARIWDAETGRQLEELRGHEGLVVGVAFSPDSTRLATSSTDGIAKVWDVATLELLVTLAGHASAVSDITFSPDGSMIATSSKDATAILWDAQTGQELRRLLGHAVETQSVAFSSDGTLIATAGGDNTARVWDVSTGEELLRLPGSQAGSYGVAFGSQDGDAQLVVASNDGIVRTFVLPVEEVLGLAQSRVTRTLTAEECGEFLHVDQCPVLETQAAVP